MGIPCDSNKQVYSSKRSGLNLANSELFSEVSYHLEHKLELIFKMFMLWAILDPSPTLWQRCVLLTPPTMRVFCTFSRIMFSHAVRHLYWKFRCFGMQQGPIRRPAGLSGRWSSKPAARFNSKRSAGGTSLAWEKEGRHSREWLIMASSPPFSVAVRASPDSCGARASGRCPDGLWTNTVKLWEKIVGGWGGGGGL